MQIVYKRLDDIHPYLNNPRFNDNAVEFVAKSIKEFGFKVPIVIDKNGEIVAGHTRYKASLELGLEEVPCIVADDLTDEQIKAFRLADNKVGEISTWNMPFLAEELSMLDDLGIDMTDYGFPEIDMPDVDDWDDWDDEEGNENERERTFETYNMDIAESVPKTDDFWQMPIILNHGYIPTDLIGFNYAMSSKEKHYGIHFFIDDYQFERLWNAPEKYIDVLSEYDCILTPDFSLYSDMTMPTKIWNTYRSRLVGAYYQSKGLRVIPTVSWAEERTYNFCFKGIPKGSIVAVSTVGVRNSEEAKQIWRDGMTEMIKQIQPSTILLYGDDVEFDYGDIQIRRYANKVTERMKTLTKGNK